MNSHYHNDHIRKNQVFLPKCVGYYYNNYTSAEIEANDEGEKEWEKAYAPTMLQVLKTRRSNSDFSEREELPYWIGYYEAIVESSENLFTALADHIIFDDSLWIEGSKLSVKLAECETRVIHQAMRYY